MRISGNEPSSVILRQTKWIQKFKMVVQEFQKQAETKRGGFKDPFKFIYRD